MPLQNRFDPWGHLRAEPTRNCQRMGNRGILHNQHKQVIRDWAGESWLICLLAYDNLKRKEIFGKGTYSELFFLDEATAFSAGHRPCAYCQRDRFNQFKAAWLQANRPGEAPTMRIGMIDRQLHTERVRRDKSKVTFEAPLSSLPDGTFIEQDSRAWLWWFGSMLEWSPQGYSTGRAPESMQTVVTVLTPSSIMRTFAIGFKPQVIVAGANRELKPDGSAAAGHWRA